MSRLRRKAQTLEAQLEQVAQSAHDMEKQREGQLYSLDLPDDLVLLDYDKPIAQQPQEVRDALSRFQTSAFVEQVLQSPEEATGRDLYKALAADLRGGDKASYALLEAGIKGLRYLDGASRTNGEGGHNYVIWDEALLTPEAAQIRAYYQRSQHTKAAYEARIDELFAGGKANRQGARVLDRSDIMGLLGYPDVPLVLAETHLIDGMRNHPEMTAKQWKKVPEWLDNPAAVYTGPKHPGRLTVIGPELLIGAPVVMAVEPSPGVAPQGHKGPHQLLVTVFAKTTGDLPSLRSLEANKRLEYVDTKKAPVAWRHTGDNPQTYRPARGAKRILTEKNLAGYRKERALLSNQSSDTTGAPHDNRIIRDDSPDTQRAVGLLNRYFERLGGDSVSFQGVRTEGIDSVVPLAQAFGTKVVGVKVREGLTARQLSVIERFNGARYQGYTYLDADTTPCSSRS